MEECRQAVYGQLTWHWCGNMSPIPRPGRPLGAPDTWTPGPEKDQVNLSSLNVFGFSFMRWVNGCFHLLRLSGAPKCPPSWSSRKSPCSWFPAPSIKSPRCGMLRPPYSVGDLVSRGQGRDTVTCYVVTRDCDTLTCHVSRGSLRYIHS